MTHLQQHTQIRESSTVKSSMQMEGASASSSSLSTTLPIPACLLSRAEAGGGRAVCERRWDVPFSCWHTARRLGFSTNWHCSSWGSCSVKKDPWSCLGQAQCFDPWGIASRMWLILIPKGYSCPVQREIIIICVGLTGDLQNSICLGGKPDFACWPAALSLSVISELMLFCIFIPAQIIHWKIWSYYVQCS